MTPSRTRGARGEGHDVLERAGRLQGKDLLLFFGWSSSYPSLTFDSPPSSAACGTAIVPARGNRPLNTTIALTYDDRARAGEPPAPVGDFGAEDAGKDSARV